jgi:hypothetical protein
MTIITQKTAYAHIFFSKRVRVSTYRERGRSQVGANASSRNYFAPLMACSTKRSDRAESNRGESDRASFRKVRYQTGSNLGLSHERSRNTFRTRNSDNETDSMGIYQKRSSENAFNFREDRRESYEINLQKGRSIEV